MSRLYRRENYGTGQGAPKMINTFFESPQQSLMEIGLTLLGIPAYLYWKKS